MRLQDHFERAKWERRDTIFLTAVFVGIILFFVLIPPDLYLYRGDMAYFHAAETAVRESLHNGQLPLWNIYYAEPLLANPQSMVLFPTHVLLRFLPIRFVLAFDIYVHIWLTVAALYLMLHDWGLSRIASAGSALTIGLSSLIMVRAMSGHLAQLPTYPWAILAVFFYRRLLHDYRFTDFVLTVLATSTVILSGHTQQSLTALLIPGSYFLYYVLSHRSMRQILAALGLSALVGVVSIGLLGVQLLPTLEYFPQTVRVDGFTLEEAAIYSLHPLLFMDLISPFLIYSIYPPPGVQEQIFYTGSMTLGLILIAWRFGADQYRGLVRYLVIVSVLAVLLAMGIFGPLFGFVFSLLPFLRAPGRFLQLFTFTFALLTGIGIEALLEGQQRPKRMLWIVFLIQAEIILFVVVWRIITPVPELVLPTGKWPEIIVSVVLVVVWLVGLLLQFTKLSYPTWLKIFIGTLVLDAAITAIFLMSWPMYRNYYPSVIGDISAKSPFACLAKHVDAREVRLSPDLGPKFVRTMEVLGVPGLEDYSAKLTYPGDLMKLGTRGTDLLAASYLITTGSHSPGGDWASLTRDCGLTLWKHNNVLPRIYAVSKIQIVPDTRQASLAAVEESRFDPLESAIVAYSADRPKLPTFPSTPFDYAANITVYSHNEIHAEVQTSQRALVVIADPIYPGWQATVDGSPTDILRVNHALRGVIVEEGQHEIVLKYAPTSFLTGLVITIGTIVLVCIVGAIIAIRGRYRPIPTD